jgi:hypothetical protein
MTERVASTAEPFTGPFLLIPVITLEPLSHLKPGWLHVDEFRRKFNYSFGEMLVAATCSRASYFVEWSGSVGFAIPMRNHHAQNRRATIKGLRNNKSQIPEGRVSAEALADRHGFTLSEFIMSATLGHIPSAVFASRQVWFKQADADAWLPPTFGFVLNSKRIWAKGDKDQMRGIAHSPGQGNGLQ